MTEVCTKWPYELPDKINSIDDMLFFIRQNDKVTVQTPNEKGSITFDGESWRNAVGELLSRTRYYYGMYLALKSTCETMQGKIDFLIDQTEDLKNELWDKEENGGDKFYCLECGSELTSNH